jgi:phosphoheptose isomerase
MSCAPPSRARGVGVVAFLGRSGGPLRDLADLALVIPSEDTARIQELHLALEHVICEWLETRLAG